MWRPQSIVRCSLQIWIASRVLLFQYPWGVIRTLADSQSVLCWSLYTCPAILFWSSPLQTAYLCSLILVFKLLLITPIYFSSQSLHGTSYTTSFQFSGEVFSFTCTTNCLKLLCGLNTALTPRGAHAFSNISLVPRMYGVYRIFGLFSGWLSSSRLLGNG